MLTNRLDKWDYFKGQTDTLAYLLTLLQDHTKEYTCASILDEIHAFIYEDLPESSHFYISGRKDTLRCIQRMFLPLDHVLEAHDIERLYRYFSDMQDGGMQELRGILKGFVYNK
jgi:hypothetical protein